MSEAVIQMSSKGFGVVGVVGGDGELVGVITDGDLRRHMSQSLLLLTVETVMSHMPRVITPGMLASAAMEMMQSQRSRCCFWSMMLAGRRASCTSTIFCVPAWPKTNGAARRWLTSQPPRRAHRTI